MNWLIYLSWWLSGIIAGLTIAQLLVSDDGLSKIILYISLAVLLLQLALLAYVIIRVRRGDYEDDK